MAMDSRIVSMGSLLPIAFTLFYYVGRSSNDDAKKSLQALCPRARGTQVASLSSRECERKESFVRSYTLLEESYVRWGSCSRCACMGELLTEERSCLRNTISTRPAPGGLWGTYIDGETSC
jgi:hypothetical protein